MEPAEEYALNFRCVALVSCIALRNERQMHFIPTSFAGLIRSIHYSAASAFVYSNLQSIFFLNYL